MSETNVRHIIIITDGDWIASQVVQLVATQVNGRCISRSAGNPTPLSGEEIVELILQAEYDPVLVMFDDNGHRALGNGEKALLYVARHPRIKVLGAIAVASKTDFVQGAHVHLSITKQGHIVQAGVDKYGQVQAQSRRVYGDTVDSLNRLGSIPLIVGIGDIGKMTGKDDPCLGAPITRKAVELILERSGFYELDYRGKKESSY